MYVMMMELKMNRLKVKMALKYTKNLNHVMEKKYLIKK